MPDFFLLLATEFRVLFHRPGAASIANFAAFLIFHRLLKTAFGGFFIDFCTADLAAAAHDVNIGLFAAHQAADDFINQTVINQGLNAFGYFHVRAYWLGNGQRSQRDFSSPGQFLLILKGVVQMIRSEESGLKGLSVKR